MKLRYETRAHTHPHTHMHVRSRAHTPATLDTPRVFILTFERLRFPARAYGAPNEDAFCRAVVSNFPVNAVTNVSDSGVFIFENAAGPRGAHRRPLYIAPARRVVFSRRRLSRDIVNA